MGSGIAGANGQPFRGVAGSLPTSAAYEVDPSNLEQAEQPEVVDGGYLGRPSPVVTDCLTASVQREPEKLGQPEMTHRSKRIPGKEMTVRKGDCMWSMAEDHLRAVYRANDVGRPPNRKEIRQYWSRFVSANPVGKRVAPGTRIKDVDLIQPGWKLDAPPVELPDKENGGPSVPAHRLQNTGGKAAKGGTSPGKVRATVLRSIEDGQSHAFVNSRGDTTSLSVHKTAPHLYRMQVGGTSFRVQFQPGASDDEAQTLAKVADLYSRHSPKWRRELEVVRFQKGPGPKLEQGGTAAAITQGRRITLYHGDSRLRPDVFDHELGHLAGRHIDDAHETLAERRSEMMRGEDDVTPPGWEEAARSDRASQGITPYARAFNQRHQSLAEDFAEAYMLWQKAKDEGPASVRAFKRQFPRRTQILEKYGA